MAWTRPAYRSVAPDDTCTDHRPILCQPYPAVFRVRTLRGSCLNDMHNALVTTWIPDVHPAGRATIGNSRQTRTSGNGGGNRQDEGLKDPGGKWGRS